MGAWILPAARTPSFEPPGTFTFLGHTERLDAVGWNDPALPMLWRYNLHYFDDLNALGSETRSDAHVALMRRWIEENPAGTAPGWAPYPTSVRIVNWIKFARRTGALDEDIRHSLWNQSRWLRRNLEHHLLGNHLFTNAKALVFAGTYFAGEEADELLRKGLEILERQLPEQILADGGQFERSTMYHALAVEDVLDLENAVRAFRDTLNTPAIAAWRARVPGMLQWLAAMTSPDGELSFFNDAAIGVAPPVEQLLEYARDLGWSTPSAPIGITDLEASGYARLSTDDATLIFDAAPIGPDYLPGHAHADTLSFELSIGSQRVFVNSGTSEYENGPERLRQRGTAAHNTVLVDGENSSEVWGSFRVARRARVFARHVGVQSGILTATATHDGYRRLPGKVLHQRSCRLAAGMLEVSDTLTGRYGRAAAYYHLHPSIHVESDRVLSLPNGRRVTVEVAGARVRVENSSWHPGFGASIPTRVIVLDFESETVLARFRWSD